MNYRNGLKALGLSLLAALGLMALATGGAQASVLIEGLSAPWTAAVVGEAENGLKSRILLLKLNLEIFCHSRTLLGTVKDTGHGHATIFLEECLATDANLAGEECAIADMEVKVLFEIILHGNKPYLLFSPLDGLTFTTVLSHNECTLPEQAAIKGSFVAKIENPDTDEVTKLISTREMLTLFAVGEPPIPDLINYGAHVTHLETDTLIELTGEHRALKWGAV